MATPTANFAFLKPVSAELFDVATYDANLDAIDSAINNPGPTQTKLPLGLMAEVDMTTASAAAAALMVVTNLASFTFKANRRYLVEWIGTVKNNTANTIALCQIQTCAVTDSASATTGLTEIRGASVQTSYANDDVFFVARRHIMYTSDTTLQIKGTILPQLGGGSVTFDSGPTWPGQLTVTDEGKQF